MTLDAALTAAADPAALDAADPLAPFRRRFVIPDPDLVYLDGNSLGRPPLAALERLARVAAEEWAGELIRGCDHWLDAPRRVGDLLGTGILADDRVQNRVGDLVAHLVRMPLGDGFRGEQVLGSVDDAGHAVLSCVRRCLAGRAARPSRARKRAHLVVRERRAERPTRRMGRISSAVRRRGYHGVTGRPARRWRDSPPDRLGSHGDEAVL